MKVTAVILLLAFSATVFAFPSSKSTDDVELVPPKRANPYGDQVIIDTSADGALNGPFDGLLEGLQGMMNRMRQQMESLLNHFHPRGNGTDFPGFQPGLQFPPISELDLSKGNTTSVTKVIDGHKVVINETEFKQDGDFGGSYFKVRIIDLQPDSGEQNLPTERDAETIAESLENEIPKNKQKEAFGYDNIETFDEFDTSVPASSFYPIITKPTWTGIEPINSVENNAIDLSHDIDVNKIMAEQGAPVDPDAEILDPETFENRGQWKPIINPR